MSTSVLLITNHAVDEGCPGAMAAIKELAWSGELGGVAHVHAGESASEACGERNRRVVESVRRSDADLILVLSLKNAVTDMDGLEKAIADRPILYWEGDPWGRGKRISEPMRRWLRASRTVFSVGGAPQSDGLRAAGARDVRFIPHTYDHVLFAICEQSFTWNPAAGSVGFLGSNLMKAPLISGLPGSWQRFELIRRLRRECASFALAGPGWPPGWSQGAIPFAEQVAFLQSCSLLTAWDHYPHTADYTSDRLAISMVAGRPQVSTRHPGMRWVPGPEHGVFLADDVNSAVHVARECLSRPIDELRALGRAAHEWARVRMSHRNAFRYMLSAVVPEVTPPHVAPWDGLPAV